MLVLLILILGIALIITVGFIVVHFGDIIISGVCHVVGWLVDCADKMLNGTASFGESITVNVTILLCAVIAIATAVGFAMKLMKK